MGGRRAGSRRLAVAAVLALSVGGVAACGDDGGDDEVALEDVEPVVDLDPCTLLDAPTAESLSGAEVDDAVQEVADDGTISCQFAFADGGVADVAGSSIAASLTFAPGDEGDVPGGSLATALPLGDAGAVEEEEAKVRVVYVVETVVVKVEVAPADGEVTDELVEEVVEFAETTEEPVTEAVTGEPPAPDPTTTTEAPTTTAEATGTTVDLDVVNLWRRTAGEFRDQVGEQFEFECPGPHPQDIIAAVWGTDVYTDDSSVCIAAVHAGVITLEDGGTVTIEMRPGQEAYPPSEANGITSQEWGSWPGSFAVVDG